MHAFGIKSCFRVACLSSGLFFSLASGLHAEVVSTILGTSINVPVSQYFVEYTADIAGPITGTPQPPTTIDLNNDGIIDITFISESFADIPDNALYPVESTVCDVSGCHTNTEYVRYYNYHYYQYNGAIATGKIYKREILGGELIDANLSSVSNVSNVPNSSLSFGYYNNWEDAIYADPNGVTYLGSYGYYVDAGSTYPWGNNEYLGFSFLIDGLVHFGWVDLYTDGFSNTIIYAWGYETDPNTAIIAGQTAAEVIPQYQLSVDKIGTGVGTVVGSGIDCGAVCLTVLEAGSATLVATPAAGSVFSGWGGACSGNGECSVVVNADTNVSATFTQQNELVVSTAGNGTGTVTGNGIDCGLTCALYLEPGSAVSLTATPSSDSVFTGWSGACSGTGVCNTTMDASQQVTATFVASTQPYTLTVTTSGKGNVRSFPLGINCGKQCSTSVAVGATVTLRAKPIRGHSFLGWSGACSGTVPSCTVPMLSDQSVQASFN